MSELKKGAAVPLKMPHPRMVPRVVRRTATGVALGCALCAAAPWTRAQPAGPPPLTSIRELLDTHPSRGDVLLRGVITYNGAELIVQDQTGAVAVSSGTPIAGALGDEVEVRGRLLARTGIPLVQNAAVRILWPGSTPLPLAITPDEAAEGAYNGMLVAIEGDLVKAIAAPDGALRLTLGSGNQIFTCTLDAGASPVTVPLTVGSTLRCTGVLSFTPPERAFESGTFLVLSRSGADVHLLVPAPWWTPEHMLLLFLLSLPVCALGFHIHLKNVRGRMTLIVEERLRIAREIHDTLAQGFSGIAMQLQSVSRTMDPGSAAGEHLAMALQMVRRSRAEAHRSIATLRTLHADEGLAAMLRKLLRQQTEPARLSLTVTQRGTAFALHDEITSQLLRISQESVANTIEHAAARGVEVTLVYEDDHVALQVVDDGHGFDPATAGTVETGHFGIAGMQERASQIRASFSIHSDAGGTRLSLRIPVARDGTRLPRPLLRLRSGLEAKGVQMEGARR